MPCLETFTVQYGSHLEDDQDLSYEWPHISKFLRDIVYTLVGSGTSPLLKSVTWVYGRPATLAAMVRLSGALEALRRVDSQLSMAGVVFYVGRCPAGFALDRMEAGSTDEVDFTTSRDLEADVKGL